MFNKSKANKDTQITIKYNKVIRKKGQSMKLKHILKDCGYNINEFENIFVNGFPVKKHSVVIHEYEIIGFIYKDEFKYKTRNEDSQITSKK